MFDCDIDWELGWGKNSFPLGEMGRWGICPHPCPIAIPKPSPLPQVNTLPFSSLEELLSNPLHTFL